MRLHLLTMRDSQDRHSGGSYSDVADFIVDVDSFRRRSVSST